MNSLSRLIALAALAAAAAACTPSAPAEPPPLAGARIGAPFTLTDQDGRSFSDRQLAGRWRIMYFGYTFCPDVCPVDTRNLGAGLQRFEAAHPERGARVVPVFITVDPARDTPAALKAFLGNFHPRFIGLTGSVAQVDAVAKDFLIVARRQPPPGPGQSYLVDHSRQAYLMDPQGNPVALLPQDETPEAVAAALDRWVR